MVKCHGRVRRRKRPGDDQVRCQASRGIGKNIALSLARIGIGIVLTYQSNKTEGERVAEEIQASGGVAQALQLDVAMTSSFDAFFDQLKVMLPEKFGTETIDFLVNNAGFGKAIPIEDLTEPDFDRFVNVHFKGVVFLTQKALTMMNDGGGVVFITAAADRYNVPKYAVYGACKEPWRSSRDMWRKNMARVASGRTPSHLVAS